METRRACGGSFSSRSNVGGSSLFQTPRLFGFNFFSRNELQGRATKFLPPNHGCWLKERKVWKNVHVIVESGWQVKVQAVSSVTEWWWSFCDSVQGVLVKDKCETWGATLESDTRADRTFWFCFFWHSFTVRKKTSVDFIIFAISHLAGHLLHFAERNLSKMSNFRSTKAGTRKRSLQFWH